MVGRFRRHGFRTPLRLWPSLPEHGDRSQWDSILIVGEGTLSVHSKSVTGGGTFTHNSAGGGSVSGTWTAEQLLSFKSYGSSPLLPPNFEAGKALILVHFEADGGAGEGYGILTIGCQLPEVRLPRGMFEGVKFNVLGGINFYQVSPSATLFIRQ